MSQERTLSIIKPDAVGKHLIGEIIGRFERAGLRVEALKMVQLTRDQVAEFYAEHQGKPFYELLMEFMVSGPVCVQVLAGENAIARNREIMGVTDPAKADPGTIRADFAESVSINAVHGSDSPESAAREISFFFKTNEIFARQ
ncbi:nucleoside-diphosphate kinase [Marinimicrobium alkaliphilum]|uniref:nucleoside-diphosphate kinase n=1 Tax=Marinimicrobium alkaliphilum TaxID=2202654 RepID=UPI000DBAB950|nr:nucleoside-diphosphate kinase [Marinimicrobium alkaliphilum]